MPFAVFRRHQRKLLAVFAILSMGAFVLSDTLYRFSAGSSGRQADPVVVTLWGKRYRASDLNAMKLERSNANLFIAELIARLSRSPAAFSQQFFGDLSTRSIVDALILEHEADRLRMPRTKDVAQEWLREQTKGLMTRDLFEDILSRFNNRVSGEQILEEIANQVRIMNVRNLLGEPVVTPLDVYRAYRDENERVSAKAVEFRVEDYAAKVKDPTDAEVRAFYEKYKDVLPDPDRDTPGFKVPRQVRVEILSADSAALARELQPKLTDAELLTYYENRKGEFTRFSEFPPDIFTNDPKGALTPPLVRPFAEVRPSLAISLAEEKAQAQIADTFNDIKEKDINPFLDEYYKAKDEIDEAQKEGEKTTARLPEPTDLKAAAERAKLDYDKSPLLTRAQAEEYGQIHDAEYGTTRFSGGRKFADELFDPKSQLFESVEFTSPEGRRFLVRKIEDHPPRVPPLDEIRAEVVHAWKLDQARPLAEKAAEELAAKLRKEGGKVTGDVVDGHRVITTSPVSKLQTNILPGQFFPGGPATPAEIPEIPQTGDALRDALFGLKPDSVAVAPNQPKTAYYVLTLNNRTPATFDDLYRTTGDSLRFQREVQLAAARRRQESWLNELRAQAKLPPDWAPPDDKKGEAESE